MSVSADTIDRGYSVGTIDRATTPEVTTTIAECLIDKVTGSVPRTTALCVKLNT